LALTPKIWQPTFLVRNEMTEFEFKVTIKGSVAHIDLSRPNEGNALTRAMMFQLAKSLRTIGADPSINLLVIEGTGDFFCKGRDGKGESRIGMTPYEVRVNMMGAVLDVYKAITDDLTLISSQAKFSFPEIEHDIPPTMAMCAALGKIPAKALSYLIYSAETVDATEAKVLGIASNVYAQATFEAEFNAFIDKLASKPRLVLETIKKYQEKATHASPDMALEYAGTLLALVRS
jgi:enoyl-CoA hydratase/carnithine racemase